MEQGYELTLSNMSKAVLNESQKNEIYISLYGKYTAHPDEEPFDLAEKIQSFFIFNEASMNDPKVMLLMGDTGSGKSVFSQQLYHQLWKAFKAGDPIPLWIPLLELENPFEGAVEEVLTKYGFDEAQIAEIKAKERFIFVVDGYDELHQFQNCYVTNNWGKWQAKVLITCRSQALYYQTDPDKYFMPFNGEKRLPMLLRKLYVAPFSKEQIYAYVKHYQQLNTENKISEEDFTQVPGLTELITTPFLLHLAVQALPEILANLSEAENQKMTQAKLYDVFIDGWFARQVKKLQLVGQLNDSMETSKQRFWDYCKKLAQLMHAKELSVIPYTQQKMGARLFGKKEKTNIWEPFFNEKTEVTRSACPLKRMGDHHYGFIHTSFVEYFATRAMYEEIQAQTVAYEIQKEDKEEDILIIEKDTQNKKPKGGIHERVFAKERQAIQFLADRIEMSEVFKLRMVNILAASKSNDQYAIGAANGITALVRAGVTLNGADLRGIKISGAEISGGYFDQTDFEGADLSNVRLANGWLRGAILRNCRSEGLNFGESPSLSHGEQILCFAFNSELKRLVSASKSKIILWSIESWENLQEFAGFPGTIWNLSISANEEIFASGTLAKNKNDVLLWNLTQNQEVILSGHQAEVSCVNHSADGQTVVSGSMDTSVRVWNVKSRSAQILTGHKGIINSVRLSADGNKVVSSNATRGPWNGDIGDFTTVKSVIRVWDLNTTQAQEIVLEKNVHNVVISGNGNRVAAVLNNNTFIWDIDKNQTFLLKPPKPSEENFIQKGHARSLKEKVWCLHMSLDGTTVVTGSDASVRIWNVESKKSLMFLVPEISHIYISEDGQTVSFSKDNNLILRQLWGAQNSSNLKYNDNIKSVHISANGMRIASAGNNQSIQIRDVTNGEVSTILRGHETTVNCVQLSADAKILVSGSFQRVYRWNVESCESMQVKEYDGEVSSININASGNTIITGSGGMSGVNCTVGIWDVGSDQLRLLEGHLQGVKCVCLSYDETMIVSGSLDGTVRSWNMINGDSTLLWDSEEILDSPNMMMMGGPDYSINSISLSADGIVMAVGTESLIGQSEGNMVRVGKVDCHKPVDLLGHKEPIISVQLNNIGNRVISASEDKTVRIWDVELVSQIAIMQFNSVINCITLHDTVGLLAIGLSDGSLQLWKRMSDDYQSWQLKWSTTKPNQILTLESCDVRGSFGLSDSNIKLFEQRGAVVDGYHNSKTLKVSSELLTQVASRSRSPLHQSPREDQDSFQESQQSQQFQENITGI